MTRWDDDLNSIFDITWMTNATYYRHPKEAKKLKPYLARRRVDDRRALQQLKQQIAQVYAPWMGDEGYGLERLACSQN